MREREKKATGQEKQRMKEGGRIRAQMNIPKKQTLFFWGFKIIADGDCSHAIKRCLLLGRKAMTHLDSILKSRDITLPTKFRLVKALVFPVVM